MEFEFEGEFGFAFAFGRIGEVALTRSSSRTAVAAMPMCPHLFKRPARARDSMSVRCLEGAVQAAGVTKIMDTRRRQSGGAVGRFGRIVGRLRCRAPARQQCQRVRGRAAGLGAVDGEGLAGVGRQLQSLVVDVQRPEDRVMQPLLLLPEDVDVVGRPSGALVPGQAQPGRL